MPNQSQLADTYQQRSTVFAGQEARERQQYERLSWVRLFLFVGLLALIILCWSWVWWAGLLSFAIGIALFARFVRWHNGFQDRAHFLQQKIRINREEIAALAGDTSAFGAGRAYIDTQHPYTYDLDVFGEHTLFPFLNRTTTQPGERCLADWLNAPADTPAIQQRQGALQELSTLLDWRQDFRATGLLIKEDPQGIARLLRWLADPPLVADRPLLRAALWGVPLLGLVGLLLWIFVLPWFVAILFLVPAGLLLRNTTEAVNRLHTLTSRATDTLATYAALMQRVEEIGFTHPHLQTLGDTFLREQKTASQAIRQLGYYLSQLDVRYNAFVIVLEITVLWDLQWVYRLDRWKEEYCEQLPAWFAALAELEALASLANTRYNQPDWHFPAVQTEPQLQATALGHPLLLAATRVPNDIGMPTRGHIHLITGSNMAGKSTWLRTVGLNIVLALAGAPVCARTLRLPQLQVYTSMRTQDALHESTSSFYAELKRLRFIIDAVENTALTGGRPVFFLLDEILKGTNSRDRHTGSKALIRQLIRKRGGGLIATHDLELGALEAEANGTVENWRIEVAIENGKLHFDYTLKRGVSESFNATLLMRQMGIDIPEE